MALTVTSQIHFDQVSRGFLQQRRGHVGVSSDEIVDLLGAMAPLGTWRLVIETGQVFWSEDAARVHGMEPSYVPVSLNTIMANYHPEDSVLITELVGTATAQHNSFRFVMRVEDGRGGYRLVAVAGRHRADNGGELVGYCHEFRDMVRSVILEGD